MPRARIVTLLCIAALIAAPSASAASRRTYAAPRGMVVAPEREAAAAGLSVLKDGGNAVDAAVATVFALAVSHPSAGNLGGGGFLLYRAPDGSHFALDFRETAPGALLPSMFLDASGHADPKKSRGGGLSVGVPGSVAGLADAHRRWGSRPWSELLRPAIRLCQEGVVITPGFAEVLTEEGARLAADPAARAIFTKNGAPLKEGDRLVQKDLGKTLALLAAGGPAAFYDGPIADAVIKGIKDAGGVMTHGDLRAYRAVLRVPLKGAYRGKTIIAFPPPSSGGIVLLQALAMLSRFDLAKSGAGSALTLHRIAEVERRAFADRSAYLGDPDRVTVPTAALLDPAYLTRRAASIRDDRATPSSRIGPGAGAVAEGANTMHLSIADARGSVVAWTTTLNSSFGAAIVAPGTGVLLNNEIDDFALSGGVPNQFGLVGGLANAVAGGKRPLSSMCPTIVEDGKAGGRPILVLGSPGGPRIISAVLQTILHVVDDGMTLQEAVDAPRIHQQWIPDEIAHERRAFPPEVAAGLAKRGHKLTERDSIGDVLAIGVDSEGRWTGAPDPREEGVALGY